MPIFLIGIKSMILKTKSNPLMITWMSSGINAFINSSNKKILIEILSYLIPNVIFL